MDKKRGRPAKHSTPGSRSKAYRARRGRRVDVFLGEKAAENLNLLQFLYQLSFSDIVDGILASETFELHRLLQATAHKHILPGGEPRVSPATKITDVAGDEIPR